MKYGVKIRIYPNKEQEKLLFYYCKIFHDSWNFLVAKYKDIGKLPNIDNFGIDGYKPNMLKSDMNENIPQRIYLGVLKTYAKSVKNVYINHTKEPKFHKYNPNKQSFYCSSKTLPIRNNSVKIITIRGCKMQSKNILLNTEDLNYYKCTEIIEPRYTYYKGQWYISGCFNKPDIIKNNSKEWLGLDWGIKNFMTTSNNDIINYPKSILRQFERIKHIQKIKDKKIKYSNNYNKIINKLNSAYDRMYNFKRDFVEKKTKEVCVKYNISVEDIDMTDFMKNKHKNKYIRQKSVIHPVYLFIRKLKWKCEKYGSYFIKVDPNYTSMSCCKCGTIKEDLKLYDRVFICECCGNIIDRDLNAAINIRERGKLSLPQ